MIQENEFLAPPLAKSLITALEGDSLKAVGLPLSFSGKSLTFTNPSNLFLTLDCAYTISTCSPDDDSFRWLWAAQRYDEALNGAWNCAYKTIESQPHLSKAPTGHGLLWFMAEGILFQPYTPKGKNGFSYSYTLSGHEKLSRITFADTLTSHFPALPAYIQKKLIGKTG